MPGHCAIALVVDAAIAEHFEILQLVPLRRRRTVEAIEHAGTFDRTLLHAVDDRRLRDAGCFQNRRGDVDHVAELRTNLVLRLDALGPMHERAVACAAPVRSHLLGPLIGRIHRVRPTDSVMVE